MIYTIPSIFIPRISHNQDEKYIERIFWQLFGCYQSPIVNIDLVERTDINTGYVYKMGFIFFRDFDDENETIYKLDIIRDIIKKIENNEEISVIHTYPWFWKLYKNTGKKYNIINSNNLGVGEQKCNSQKRIISETDIKKILSKT